MTKTEHTTVFFKTRMGYALFVNDLESLEAGDYILTMTIKRSKSGEFSASAATLRSEATLR